jgi:hypothetical protein
MTSSGPHIPKASQHALCSRVVIGKAPFLLGEDIVRRVKEHELRSWRKRRGDDKLEYIYREQVTENDTSHAVRMFLECVVEALDGIEVGGVKFDAKRLSLREAADISSLRADYWMLLDNGRVVGCVEVKKEGEKLRGADTLDDGYVLGQLYDYIRVIESLHGTRPVFGILTTHNHWRVCWYGDLQGASGRETAPSVSVLAMHSPMPHFQTPSKGQESTEDAKKNGSPPRCTMSSKLAAKELNLVEVEEEETGDIADEKRELFVSNVIKC